jgi:hypothetical protein
MRPPTSLSHFASRFASHLATPAAWTVQGALTNLVGFTLLLVCALSIGA